MSGGALVSIGFLAALADATLSDLAAFRIPNRDSIALVVLYGLAAMLSGAAMPAVLSHFGAAAAVFLGGAILFALGVWGGGDAKLLAAVAAWTGFAGLPRLLAVMAVAGGVLAAAVLILRRLRPVQDRTDKVWCDRLAASGHVPYAVAIAAGALDWWMGAPY